MDIVVWESEAHEDDRDAQAAVQLTDEGNGATAAGEGGRNAPGLGDGALGGLHDVAVTGKEDGCGNAGDAEFGLDRWVGGGGDVLSQAVGNFLGVLVGDEAEAEAGDALAGDDDDDGLEGGMFPGFDGVDRLYVVVAVEEEGGFVGGLEPVGVDAGVTVVGAVEDLDVVEADFGEVAGEPLGAGLDVFAVLGLGGDGGEGDQFGELGEPARSDFGVLAVLEGAGGGWGSGEHGRRKK